MSGVDALTGEDKGLGHKIVARITGVFDWRKEEGRGGRRGHTELSEGSYLCPTDGKAINARDRRAKRYHPRGGHKR
jgi:hypothetical protein